MGIQLQLILAASCTANLLQFAQSTVSHRVPVDDERKVHIVNFQNLFDSIAKKDTQKIGIYRNILQQDEANEKKGFHSMKEELQIMQNKKIRSKKNVNEINVPINGRRTRQISKEHDEPEETMPPSNPRKALSSKQIRPMKTSNAETELVPKDEMMDILRKKIPHHEHQLPAIPNKNGTQQNCHHCDEYRQLVGRYHNIFKKLMDVKDEKPPGTEEEEMTFEEALRKAPGWLLCLAKSKVMKVKHKLEEAKRKYCQVFELMNREAGDVAGEIDDTYSKICRRLDLVCEKQESTINRDDPEEFMRREILRRFNLDGELSNLKN